MTDWGEDDKNNMFVMRSADLPRLEQATSLEEARKLMAALVERNKTQGHLLVAWKRRLKEQNETLFRLHRDREEQMRILTSQLLLLEANLRSKQQKIDVLLNQRDRVISQQQETIQALEKELNARRLSPIKSSARPDSLPVRIIQPVQPSMADDQTTLKSRHLQLLTGQEGSDSLEDSDSAVVIEDGPDSHSPTFKSDDPRNPQVRVIRSISDVVAAARASLHAVDVDVRSASPCDSSDEAVERQLFSRGSFDRQPVHGECKSPAVKYVVNAPPFNGQSPLREARDLPLREPPPYAPPPPPPPRVQLPVIYARAVNNHRSVTRPRDIKCRKINKGLWKSSSMEAECGQR